MKGEDTNPLNNMPQVAEQSVWPGQDKPLQTSRVVSSIPRGDEQTPAHQTGLVDEPTWVYPSEQQFFNAMKRKGWKPQEEDMTTVVAIHNAVNERTWAEVLRWENKFHASECDYPKLARFQGRPTDMSPKARFMTMLGFTAPFDRHDWTVDRCGEHVRYVIDFYRGRQVDPRIPASFHIDARPALDSTQALKDRVKMAVAECFF